MREKVGTVFVDAGLVWIGDPCYVMGDDASSRVTNWITGFCDKLTERNVNTPLGKGTGMAISSGYGDGEYPVYVEYSDEGAWGVRVKSVTVEFLEDEDDDVEGDEDEDDWESDDEDDD